MPACAIDSDDTCASKKLLAKWKVRMPSARMFARSKDSCLNSVINAMAVEDVIHVLVPCPVTTSCVILGPSALFSSRRLLCSSLCVPVRTSIHTVNVKGEFAVRSSKLPIVDTRMYRTCHRTIEFALWHAVSTLL